MSGTQTDGLERLAVDAPWKNPCPAACANLWSVSLAMTHMQRSHGQGGHESTGFSRSVVQCVGGLRA